MFNKSEYAVKDVSYFLHNRGEMLQFVPKSSKRILEIGCGSGGFASIVKKSLECIYIGVEPDHNSSERAKDYIDHVYNQEFSLDLFNGDMFDCIIFNDVLEHIPYPDQILKDCRSLLAPQGVIISSIPNFRFYSSLNELLFKKDFPKHDSGIFDRTHMRFFTKKSIVNMFHECGFDVDKIIGINRQPVKSKKFRLLKSVLPKTFDDIDVLQFAIVASKR